MDELSAIADKYAQIVIDEVTEIIIQAFTSLYNFAYKELYDEAMRMYKAYMDQYYSYKTRSYWRHGVGRGTGTGQNLYLGNKIELIEGDAPQLIIRFSGDGMKGYRFDSTDDVLEQVMYGIRGVPEDRHGKSWTESWSGSFSGRYFSSNEVMIDAFNTFDAKTDEMAEKIIDRDWGKVFKEISKQQSAIIANNTDLMINEAIPYIVKIVMEKIQ